MQKEGLDVIAIGKIGDIFNGRGITNLYNKNNMDGINKTIQYINKRNKGIIFTNLVDLIHFMDTEGPKRL